MVTMAMRDLEPAFSGSEGSGRKNDMPVQRRVSARKGNVKMRRELETVSAIRSEMIG